MPGHASFLDDAKHLLDRLVADLKLTNDLKLRTLLRIHAVVAERLDRVGPSAPPRAPEFYTKRKDRDENPVTFIERVYAEWLGHGLTSADIARLDPKLSLSLRVFYSTKGRPTDFDLPTKKQRIDKLILEAGLGERAPAGHVTVRRLQEAQRIRRRKSRKE